jgi:hypothetical protein
MCIERLALEEALLLLLVVVHFLCVSWDANCQRVRIVAKEQHRIEAKLKPAIPTYSS